MAQNNLESYQSFKNGTATRDFPVSNSNSEPTSPVKYTTPLAAFIITLNVTAGIGLLAMPSAMQSAGIIISVVNQVAILFMVITTCVMCAELTLKSNCQSFHQMVKEHCSPTTSGLVQVSILLQVFGIVVSYMVIIGDLTDRVFATLYGSTFCYTWYMNRTFIMTAATVVLILPLCSSKSIDFLKYGSFVGIFTLGFVAFVVVSHLIEQDSIARDVNYLPEKPLDFMIALPVYCLAYSCQLSFVPVAANMDKTKKTQAYYSVAFSMVATTAIYLGISVLAVLSFGSKIQSDLIESFSDKNWAILTTTALLAFKCVVTLPPDFYPFRSCVIDILTTRFQVYANMSERIKRISVTYALLTVALILAILVPDILTAVDMVGFLCVLFIFVMPALCYLDLLAKQDESRAGISLKSKVKRIYCYFLIIFGCVMMVLIFYNSMSKISSTKKVEPLCHL